MSCRKIRRSLSRYYRGELSREESILIARHIETCDRCAREAQSYKALKDAAQNLDRFSPSPLFESKLEQKIRELPAWEKEPKVKSFITSFPSLRWILIPATAIALALFLFLKGDFYKSKTVSVKPESATSKETSLVRTPTKSDKSKQVLSVGLETNRDEVNLPLRKKENSRAVFVMDNLKSTDLEELADKRVVESRFTNYVMDAVNYKPVDNRQTNVGYILPAVSTSRTEVKKSH